MDQACPKSRVTSLDTYLSHICKDPISEYGYVYGHQGFGLGNVSFGGFNPSQHKSHGEAGRVVCGHCVFTVVEGDAEVAQ